MEHRCEIRPNYEFTEVVLTLEELEVKPEDVLAVRFLGCKLMIVCQLNTVLKGFVESRRRPVFSKLKRVGAILILLARLVVIVEL